MRKLKKPLLFALSLLPIAIVAGIFVGLYQLEILSPEVVEQVIAEAGSTDLLIVVGMVQTVIYAFFCGFFGYILANYLGLWKPLRFEKRSLLITLAVSVVGGILFSLDYWVFGSVIEGVQSADAAGLTLNSVIASVLYGGIIEELLLRLFFMSLIAWVIRMVFYRKRDCENVPAGVFVAANIIAAAVFAAGHLPATAAIFGELTPLLLLRCFLLNGGFALIFGRLYRRYGIWYAMLSHALFHIVSKTIWILFI